MCPPHPGALAALSSRLPAGHGAGMGRDEVGQSPVLSPSSCPGGHVLCGPLPRGLCPGAGSLTRVAPGCRMGMESMVQGVLPAQPISTVSPPPSSGVWASASSLLRPSSSSSSPPSWWAATCRRWCARAGRAESCTRWAYLALGPEGHGERDVGRTGGSEGSLEPEGARGQKGEEE